jgi:hypothetical protein
MSVIYPPESGYAKERVKWEAQGTEMGPGLRPYVYQPFPVMVYLAGVPHGEVGAPRIIQHMVADNGDVVNNLASRGWRTHPEEAIRAYEAQKLEEAKLAAEIEFDIAKGRVSAHAAREIREAQAEVDGHLPVVPETPIRRRVKAALAGGKRAVGRPRKTEPTAEVKE